jgi:hypothetical protein
MAGGSNAGLTGNFTSVDNTSQFTDLMDGLSSKITCGQTAVTGPGPACPSQSLTLGTPTDDSAQVYRAVDQRARTFSLSQALPTNCTFDLTIITWDEDHPDTAQSPPGFAGQGQPYEQVYIEGFGNNVTCSSADGSATDLTNCTNVFFKTGLTPDIPVDKKSIKYTFGGLTPSGDVTKIVVKHITIYDPAPTTDTYNTGSTWYSQGNLTANSVHGYCIGINNTNPSCGFDGNS